MNNIDAMYSSITMTTLHRTLFYNWLIFLWLSLCAVTSASAGAPMVRVVL